MYGGKKIRARDGGRIIRVKKWTARCCCWVLINTGHVYVGQETLISEFCRTPGWFLYSLLPTESNATLNSRDSLPGGSGSTPADKATPRQDTPANYWTLILNTKSRFSDFYEINCKQRDKKIDRKSASCFFFFFLFSSLACTGISRALRMRALTRFVDAPKLMTHVR